MSAGVGTKLVLVRADKAEGGDERYPALVLHAAERALAEGQRNVAGTDDPDAELDSVWSEPLRLVRDLMDKAGLVRKRSKAGKKKRTCTL